MPPKGVPVPPRYPVHKWCADQLRPRLAQQPGSGEVKFPDPGRVVQGHIPQWGKVVEIGKLLGARGGFPVRAAQLCVLHLQFDLVDLQLMEESLGVGAFPECARVPTLLLQPGFGASAQVGRSAGSNRLLPPGGVGMRCAAFHFRRLSFTAWVATRSSKLACFSRNSASSVLAAVISAKVITTPSIRSSSVR